VGAVNQKHTAGIIAAHKGGSTHGWAKKEKKKNSIIIRVRHYHNDYHRRHRAIQTDLRRNKYTEKKKKVVWAC